MEPLILSLNTLENLQSLFSSWLQNFNLSKTSIQCSILFNISMIFFVCSSTNTLELTSCKIRFQNISHITSTRRTSIYNIVQLINENYDLTLVFNNLLDDFLYSFLKLTTILGSCNKVINIQST